MNKLALIFMIATLGGFVNTAWGNQACFNVQGMDSCSACKVTIGLAVKRLPGIENVNISVRKMEAVVQYSPNEVSDIAIQTAIDKAGYKATIQQCQNKKN